jgi:hypothetical protein
MTAATETTKEVLSFRKFSSDFGQAPIGPSTILEDNQAVIAIS